MKRCNLRGLLAISTGLPKNVSGGYNNKCTSVCVQKLPVNMPPSLQGFAGFSRSLHINSQWSQKANAKESVNFNVTEIKVGDTKKFADLIWDDGHVSRFHSSWLRFNCHCPKCKRNITGESNVDRSSLPDDLLITDIKVSDDGYLLIKLDGETVQDHTTTLPLDWLREHCYCDKCLHDMISVKEMTFADPQKVPLPTIEYKDTRDDEGRFKWFKTMIDVGFCVLKNVPTVDAKVLEVAEEISPLVYGTYEKMFDVTDTGSTANLAYTSVALPLHMDVVHLEAAPGIQLLHAMEFDDCVEGGNSILIDMFEAVRILRVTAPDDFRVLTRVPATWSITDYEKQDPIHVLNRKPIINLDYDGRVVACAWNPGTEQTLRVHEEDVDDFFRAYKKLHAITTRKDLQFNFRLYRGDLLLFNNRRFLHSRDAYKSNGGRRRLQGTYCSMEELRNKYVILGRKLNVPVVDTIIGNGSAV